MPAIPDQIRQVVLNLFMNAVEAMQSGGKYPIETRFVPDEGQILLSVSDTGPGIDPGSFRAYLNRLLPVRQLAPDSDWPFPMILSVSMEEPFLLRTIRKAAQFLRSATYRTS